MNVRQQLHGLIVNSQQTFVFAVLSINSTQLLSSIRNKAVELTASKNGEVFHTLFTDATFMLP